VNDRGTAINSAEEWVDVVFLSYVKFEILTDTASHLVSFIVTASVV
jgi:hypothetical protein